MPNSAPTPDDLSLPMALRLRIANLQVMATQLQDPVWRAQYAPEDIALIAAQCGSESVRVLEEAMAWLTRQGRQEDTP